MGEARHLLRWHLEHQLVVDGEEQPHLGNLASRPLRAAWPAENVSGRALDGRVACDALGIATSWDAWRTISGRARMRPSRVETTWVRRASATMLSM